MQRAMCCRVIVTLHLSGTIAVVYSNALLCKLTPGHLDILAPKCL